MRNLGVIFGSNFKTDMQITNAFQNAHYHLPASGDSEHSWARKPRARLYMHLSQARLTTATVLLMDYQIISSRNSSWQTSFQSEEIWLHNSCTHYADVIMTTMASQITSLTVVYSTLLFRRRSKKTSKLRVTVLCVGNSPGQVNSPHKGPVTRKMFPFDDVIMSLSSNDFMARHLATSMKPPHEAPSHYLNQCWLIIGKVRHHSSEGDFTRVISGELKFAGNLRQKISLKSPRAQRADYVCGWGYRSF